MKLKISNIKDKEKIILFLFCVVYALIVPRFKDYSYILLIVPTYYLIQNINLPNPSIFILALVILPCVNDSLPASQIFFILIRIYYPLVVAYAVWILYLYKIHTLTQDNCPAPK
jgi:hypothetical protein